MALKSGQEATPPEVIEELLDTVDTQLDRLKTLYEQYFLGIQKQAPTFIHSDVERKLRELTQLNIRNTGLRYRLATLQQKFGAYNSYWRRTLRQIENGTYLRNLAKIGREAARTGAEIPEEILAAMPKRMREQVVRDRDAALAVAKRRNQQAEDISTHDTENDVAAVIGESPELRRDLLTQRGAHIIHEDDADIDFNEFFAAFEDGTTDTIESVTNVRAPTPAPTAPPTQPLPKSAAPTGTQPGVAAPTGTQPGVATPTTSAVPRPVAQPGSASSTAATPAAQTTTAVPKSVPQPTSVVPNVGSAAIGGTKPAAQTTIATPKPVTDSGSAPTAVPPPTRAVPKFVAQSASASTATRPAIPAIPRPPTGAVPKIPVPTSVLPKVKTPPSGMPVDPGAPTQAMPKVPSHLTTQAIPVIPATQAIPRPAPSAPRPPPSQVTRPTPVVPGAAAMTGAIPVESMAGPFPRTDKAATPGTQAIPTQAMPKPSTQAMPKPSTQAMPRTQAIPTTQAVPKPSTQAIPSTQLKPPPGMTEADVNALHAKYVKAKEMVGEKVEAGSREKLLKTLTQTAPKIMEQYKASAVDFSVVVKDNQVVIKAKPKT